MKTVPRIRIIKDLEAFCDKFPTYTQAANKLGISPQQLSAARNNDSFSIGKKILKKLGYATVQAYVLQADLDAERTTKKPTAAKAKSKPAVAPAKKTVPKVKPKPVTPAAKKAAPKAKPSVPAPVAKKSTPVLKKEVVNPVVKEKPASAGVPKAPTADMFDNQPPKAAAPVVQKPSTPAEVVNVMDDPFAD